MNKSRRQRGVSRRSIVSARGRSVSIAWRGDLDGWRKSGEWVTSLPITRSAIAFNRGLIFLEWRSDRKIPRLLNDWPKEGTPAPGGPKPFEASPPRRY